MIVILLFIIDEKWEQMKFLSTDEWINVGISITLLRNLKKKTLTWKNLNISPNSIMSKYGQAKHIAQFQLH